MKLIEPTIKIDNIEIDFGRGKKEEAKEFIKSFGPFVPLIKIGEDIINIGDIIDFEYEVEYNKLPSFTLTILDEFNRFQSLLQDDEIIKGVMFVGTNIFYHKANLIFLDSIVNDYSKTITFYGNFHNPKLYESIQSSFKDKKIIDIFKEISTLTEMGLYSIDNENTTKELPIFLNTNKRYIDIIKDIVNKYTQNNFWCIDQDYFLHVQNYDTLIKKEVDKYTIKFNEQKEELPVIITNYPDPSEDTVDTIKKFVASDIIVNNNTGINTIKTSKNYSLNGESINSHDKIGFGSSSANTFSKFKNNSFPFYNEIFKKEISGNMFELKMQTPIYEIFPFMVVDCEIFNLVNEENQRKYIKNEKHSGKHIVMGYSMKYKKPRISEESSKLPELIQTIKLI